jgi:hypothetical protein
MNAQKSLRFCALFFSIFVFFQTTITASNERWIQVRSKNFNLIGNADEVRLRAVAFKLEQFREALRQVLNQMNFDSPVPTTVIVFKDANDYKPYKPIKLNGETNDSVVGYFQAGKDANYITLSAAGEPAGTTYNIIFHEYTHFLIRNNLGESKIPTWYNEGIAGYYETFALENDRKITLGGLQPKFLALLGQNNLIPFDTFFEVDNNSLHERDGNGAGLFYAQAWAFMHYLMHGEGGARKAELDTFLNLIMSGKNQKDAFTGAFKTSPAAMEVELKNISSKRLFKRRALN